MSDVHRLPDPERLEVEAAAWIARLNADDVSDKDRARFEAWRTEHPTHARAFEEMSATWDKCVAAGPLVRAVSLAQSLDEAAERPHPPRRWRWSLAATAAAVALVAVAGWWYQRAGAQTAFATAIGEHATVALPDGSTLELNSGSRARVDYSSTARVIWLERGEGFFKVAHDTQRPFWVLAGSSWVRAVGTAFNVYLKPSGVEVTVSEGAVKVGAAQGFEGAPSDRSPTLAAAAVVKAGEQADLHGSAVSTRELSAAAVQRSLTWREGVVYFENQPLGEVLDELGRYTNVHLVVTDPALRNLSLGGTFKAGPEGAEALLTMLSQGFGLKVTRDGERVLIEPPEPQHAR